MKQLIISLVIILMFDFSLNKINPITVEVKKPIVPNKEIENEKIKPCFICVKCGRDYALYCSSRCQCKCVKRSNWPFIKPSNSTTTKIIKPKLDLDIRTKN